MISEAIAQREVEVAPLPTMMCPRCKSSRATEHHALMMCCSCGYAEELIDFPVSWDWHRYYSIYYTSHDPGPKSL